MSNSFNKSRGTLPRPKVCISDPPAPSPEPPSNPIQTNCCTDPIPRLVTVTLAGVFCPEMNGHTTSMQYDEANDRWVVLEWPWWKSKTAGVRLKCGLLSGGWTWQAQYRSTDVSWGSWTPALTGGTCDPLNTTVRLRVDRDAVPCPVIFGHPHKDFVFTAS